MQQGIHPEYVDCKVTCSCGATFTTRSVKPELHIELCSQCHPFYTGKQKFVDTGGRVQRFSDKFGSAAEAVMAREAADAEARQKAHEEAETAKREARAAREAVEAERARMAPKPAPAEEKTEEAAAPEATIAEDLGQGEAPEEEPAAEDPSVEE